MHWHEFERLLGFLTMKTMKKVTNEYFINQAYGSQITLSLLKPYVSYDADDDDTDAAVADDDDTDATAAAADGDDARYQFINYSIAKSRSII